MAYVVMAMITFGWFMTAKYPALQITFAEYCMALLAGASIFAGSNVASKWVLAKNVPQEPVAKQKPSQSKQPVEQIAQE